MEKLNLRLSKKRWLCHLGIFVKNRLNLFIFLMIDMCKNNLYTLRSKYVYVCYGFVRTEHPQYSIYYNCFFTYHVPDNCVSKMPVILILRYLRPKLERKYTG